MSRHRSERERRQSSLLLQSTSLGTMSECPTSLNSPKKSGETLSSLPSMTNSLHLTSRLMASAGVVISSSPCSRASLKKSILMSTTRWPQQIVFTFLWVFVAIFTFFFSKSLSYLLQVYNWINEKRSSIGSSAISIVKQHISTLNRENAAKHWLCWPLRMDGPLFFKVPSPPHSLIDNKDPQYKVSAHSSIWFCTSLNHFLY